MSSNQYLTVNLDDITKYPEINSVILKDKEFELELKNYNTMNQEYLNELKKPNRSNQTLKRLLDGLISKNAELIHYATEIDNIRNDKMMNFNTAMNTKNSSLMNDIRSTINGLNEEDRKLSEMKRRITDAEGINKEYNSEIKHTNYKYLILLLSIIFLVISIIISITVPYKTNLESALFVILCIVVLYYLFTYVKQYNLTYKVSNQYGNLKSFLNI